MDDLLLEFLTETNESMETLDVELVKLEKNPNDPELLGNIFRLVHTVKGTCGFLGFGKLEKLAHAAENLLSLLRDGELTMTTEIADALLASVGEIRGIWETGASDLLVIAAPGGREHLVPVALLRDVDLAAGRVVVELLPGLLEDG